MGAGSYDAIVDDFALKVERRLLAESTSSANALQGGRWSHQRQLSRRLGECVLPARSRHSPALSLGHSSVGSIQETAVQFATSDVASSVNADDRRSGGV